MSTAWTRNVAHRGIGLRGFMRRFLLLFLPCVLHAQFTYTSTPFRSGESLTYKVRWSIFRVGTITVRQSYADSAFPRYMQVDIDGESAAGLPFISVYFRSDGLLDTTSPTNILYELISDREYRKHLSYVYDAVNSRCFALETEEGEITRFDTLDAPTPYFDGPGLFMYTRCAAGSDTTVVLPTIMDFAMGTTTLRFTKTIEMIDVPAFDEPVPAYLYLGRTNWKGSSFAGMSGEFKGWVSTDSTRTVLRAEVAIFLGSAVIELEKRD